MSRPLPFDVTVPDDLYAWLSDDGYGLFIERFSQGDEPHATWEMVFDHEPTITDISAALADAVVSESDEDGSSLRMRKWRGWTVGMNIGTRASGWPKVVVQRREGYRMCGLGWGRVALYLAKHGTEK